MENTCGPFALDDLITENGAVQTVVEKQKFPNGISVIVVTGVILSGFD